MTYVTIAVLFACILTIVVVYTFLDNAKFNWRWPPIDDDEFIRRCGPGVNRDTALRVRRVISDALGIEYKRIYPEQSFVKDLIGD